MMAADVLSFTFFFLGFLATQPQQITGNKKPSCSWVFSYQLELA
ncbi:hypothetical protein VCHC61A2_2979 [Vibrio cholerae HC-61A2]|nr:hypothetical protein VCHC61A2_2979 [Vibrio cholerae HC-61A2]